MGGGGVGGRIPQRYVILSLLPLARECSVGEKLQSCLR